MAQVIESYPNIMRAYLTMERCNGGINRDRTEQMALRESDPVIGAEGVDHATLFRIDEWLASLPFGSLEDFVDGDEDDILKMVEEGGQVAELAHGLFNDLFEK